MSGNRSTNRVPRPMLGTMVNSTATIFSRRPKPVDPAFLDQLARRLADYGVPLGMAMKHVKAAAVSARDTGDRDAKAVRFR
jgi:hypothetical protein